MPAFTLPVLLPTEIFHECSAGSRNTGLAPLLRFTTTHPIRKTPCSRKPTCHLQVHTLLTTSSSSPLPPLHSSPFTRSLDFFSAARRQLRPHLRKRDPSLTRRFLHFPAVSVVHPHRLFPCQCGDKPAASPCLWLGRRLYDRICFCRRGIRPIIRVGSLCATLADLNLPMPLALTWVAHVALLQEGTSPRSIVKMNQFGDRMYSQLRH